MSKKIISFFLKLLFPIECLGCNSDNTFLCQRCQSKLVVKPLSETISSIDRVLIACDYGTPLISEIIKDFKYHNIQPLAEIAANLLIARLASEKTDDMSIIPVPLHISRYRQRGFNQSFVLASYIAEYFGMQIDIQLRRIRRTHSQATLSKEKRLLNMRNAFRYDGTAPRRALLVDDVMTTGATLQEAAQALRRAGCQEIWSIVIAKNI